MRKMNFIQTNWLGLVIIALFFIYVIGRIAWSIKKKGLKGTVIEMIVDAEERFKQGQNSQKLNYVIDKVIAVIPMPLSLFITRDTIKKFAQKIFDEIKVALDYQK